MSQPSNICLCSDVLREIFILCIVRNFRGSDTYFEVMGHRKLSIRKFPQLAVSQVCSLWRNTALFTPQLWDQIYIRDMTRTNFFIAGQYLSRARNLPVSIRVLDYTPLWGAASRMDVIHFLSSYRLRSLSLEGSHRLCLHGVLPHLPPRSITDLEYLYQMPNDPDYCASKGALIDPKGIYPKLSIARIWDTDRVSKNALRIILGEKFLMTNTECLDFFRSCPSLEEVRLGLTGQSTPVLLPPAHLQHLRLLYIWVDPDIESDIPLSTFIEALSLPVIEELGLRSKSISWPLVKLQSLSRRSYDFPYLTHFNLESPTRIDACFLLALMPAVKSVSLCFYNISYITFKNAGLNRLAIGSIAPQLQSIKVGLINNVERFLDMVVSRMKKAQVSGNGVPAPFTEVVLSRLESDYGRNPASRIEELQKMGVPIQLRRYSR